ncbi:hypothetical protein M4914_21680 [Streptomyces somaliensis DSM 40738]|uniref:hypothetical protein n=1 Tax=Streptomyces somaliensis TaxID=78355 RepID=UPI0021C31FF5|nr:hypothetical protein [Streptomyces somaliensis]MCQ0025290.1 hypothetical protein [Streptomyces somaliensis DSM 40738]
MEEDAEVGREHPARAGERVVRPVAGRDGEVVGRAAFGPDRAPGAGPGDGGPCALYARPGAVGTGVGRAPTDGAVVRAAARGRARLSPRVVEGDAPGRRFHARTGFAPEGAREPWEAGGTALVNSAV